jgi:hypothetical protein
MNAISIDGEYTESCTDICGPTANVGKSVNKSLFGYGKIGNEYDILCDHKGVGNLQPCIAGQCVFKAAAYVFGVIRLK